MATADLGFIRNRRDLHIPNRALFGSPSFAAKTGVVLASPPLRVTHSDASSARAEMSHSPGNALNASVIERRCEYLEKQERQVREMLTVANDELKELRAQMSDRTMAKIIYDEAQWMYGHVSKRLLAVRSDEEDSNKVMDNFLMDDLTPLDVTGQVVLVYPMVVKVSADAEQDKRCFMRMKDVDANTGQLSYVWVLVHEIQGGMETRYVTDFSLRG